MKVQDIMTQPPQTCRVDTNLAVASRRMNEVGCGMLAVVDASGRLAGVLTDRDLAMEIGETRREAARVAADKAMSRHVHTCRPEDHLKTALGRMTSAKVRRLPVVDEDGDIKGILSIDDIILWGVEPHGVTMHDLVSALRAICAPRAVALEPEMPKF
jgi:CBS domain-containing protein